MKIFNTYIIILLLFASSLYAQNPGGVLLDLSAWYKASNTSTGAQMTDYSGNGNHAISNGSLNATIAPSSTRSVYNYNSAFQFTGNTNTYYSPPLNSDFYLRNYSIFMVLSRNARGAAYSQVRTTSQVNGEVFMIVPYAPTNKFRHTLNAINFNSDVVLPGPVGSNVYIGEVSRKVATRTLKTELIADDVHTNSTSGTHVQTYITSAQPFIGIRRMPNGTRNSTLTGDISEMIIYNRELTGTEKTKIESYLALKYGLTLEKEYLASDNSVFWDYASAGSYKMNIAGIGRDDGSDLHQKQSHSANISSYISVGLGTIAVDNYTNPNTLTDKNFLVWASDDNRNITTGYTLNGALKEKLVKDWRVKETGTIGTVRIEIPSSKINTSFKTRPLDLSLVVSDNDSYTNNVQLYSMTLDTVNNVWYVSVDFNNSKIQYFSIFNDVPDRNYMRHGKHFQNDIENPMKF